MPIFLLLLAGGALLAATRKSKSSGSPTTSRWSDGRMDGKLLANTTYTDMHGRIWTPNGPTGAIDEQGHTYTSVGAPGTMSTHSGGVTLTITYSDLLNRGEIEKRADAATGVVV